MIWKLIPLEWWHWCIVSNTLLFPTFYGDINVGKPTLVFNDIIIDTDRWNKGIQSYNILECYSVYNKHLLLTVLCLFEC